MEFSNMRVKKVITHSGCIIYIGFFSNNIIDHFYSISSNGQLKEWILKPDNKIIQLETSFLMRPGSEYLSYLGFPPCGKNDNGQQIAISAITVCDNLLFLGYEDGLVLVWKQEKRDVIDKNLFKNFERIKSSENVNHSRYYKKLIDETNVKEADKENLVRKGKFRIDDIILFNLKDDLNFSKSNLIPKFEEQLEQKVDGENDTKFNYKNYFNIFWLKYIFIEQTQEISSIYYYNYQEKHILFSASKDNTIICYNIDDGKVIYKFTLDDYVKYICFCQELTKNKKIIPKSHLTFLCSGPHKINFYFTKDEPILNSVDFPYNNINKVTFLNNNYYLLGKRGECVIFNKNFENPDNSKEAKMVVYHKSIPLFDIIQYKTNFLIFTAEFNMCFVEFKYETKKMNELFFIKFGMNRVTNLMYISDVLYVTNADMNIYSIDFNFEYQIFEEKVAMKKEELLSEDYNKYYELHKNKKKKKKKGKKGKKGKKKASTSKSPKKKKK